MRPESLGPDLRIGVRVLTGASTSQARIGGSLETRWNWGANRLGQSLNWVF